MQQCGHGTPNAGGRAHQPYTLAAPVGDGGSEARAHSLLKDSSTSPSVTPNLLDGGAVEHHALIDQEHPVVELHLVLLAVHRQAQAQFQRKALPGILPCGLAHHVVGAAGVAPALVLGQAPDAAGGAAVGIAEGLVQHALVALPMAVHDHGEAAHHLRRRASENAVGTDAAIEIAIELQRGALLGVVAHLRPGAAREDGRAASRVNKTWRRVFMVSLLGVVWRIDQQPAQQRRGHQL